MLLIDGDILVYRCGWSCNSETRKVACNTLDTYIADILCILGEEENEYIIYLSGDSADNFRHEYAISLPYKGNRKDAEKPVHLQGLRDHLILHWNAQVTQGEETDDAIAIKATLHGDSAMIVSIDKDFDQVQGWHYNFVKRRKYYVTAEDGLLFFYGQVLMGDRVDNILGIQGVGPVKAFEILAGLEGDERDMYNACIDAYMEETEDMPRAVAEEIVIENARLLWLRRTEGEIWNSPFEEKA